MPSEEYRILVSGVIVDRAYSSRVHKLMIDIYTECGIKYTTEIVSLI